MIPTFLLAWAAKAGVPERYRKDAVATVFVVLVLAAIVIGVKLHDRRVVADYETKIERRAAPATDAAADERANDKIANNKHEEELHDAVHSVPDAQPAGPSHALACKRLHDIGRDPPACR